MVEEPSLWQQTSQPCQGSSGSGGGLMVVEALPRQQRTCRVSRCLNAAVEERRAGEGKLAGGGRTRRPGCAWKWWHVLDLG